MKKNSLLLDILHTEISIGKLILIAIAALSSVNQTNAQSADTTPPEIINFSLSSTVINTSDESQNVTVNIHATDNDRGINLIAVRFRSPSGNQFVNAFINNQQRVSGDDKSGFYSQAVTFPRYSKAGMWSVSEIETRDAANNYKTLNKDEIASLGFAAELQITSNNEDLTAPEISDLSFAPAPIDTTDGAQTVNITVRATDALSGVRSVNVYFSLASSDYLVSSDLTVQHLVSGDNKDGVYSGTITFPQGIDSGMWRVAVSTVDAIGNRKTIDTGELAARGYTTELQVVNGTSSTPPTQKSRKRQRLF